MSSPFWFRVFYAGCLLNFLVISGNHVVAQPWRDRPPPPPQGKPAQPADPKKDAEFRQACCAYSSGGFIVVCLIIWCFSAVADSKRRAAEEIQKKATEEQQKIEQARKLEEQKKEDERRRVKAIIAQEEAAREAWIRYHESKSMEEIAKMSGIEFERFLARLLSKMGYTQINLTPTTNDQGGDILCVDPSGARVVIQAKRWAGTVGNSAVQELLGAMVHYECAIGMVVTNSTFSESARTLAKKAMGITLHDREWLAEQVKEFFPTKVPPFNRDDYNKYVVPLIPNRPPASPTRFFKKKRRRRWY